MEGIVSIGDQGERSIEDTLISLSIIHQLPEHRHSLILNEHLPVARIHLGESIVCEEVHEHD